MKDINSSVDSLLVQEIKKAFLRGLCLKWFISQKNDQKAQTWFYKPIGSHKSKEIITSDGKQAGATFYELYLALIDNIQIVLDINGYSDALGTRIPGKFNEQYTKDAKKTSLANWLNHAFIKRSSEPIHYEKHPKIAYNILDVCLGLHRENNQQSIRELGQELLKLLVEEFKTYHKQFYGQGDHFVVRLRVAFKKLLRTSYFAQNKYYEKYERENWKRIILDALEYRTESTSEIDELFKM